MKELCILASFAALTISMSYFAPVFADVQFARIAGVIMRDESVYEPGCTVPLSVRVVALGSRGDPYFIAVSTKHEKSGMLDSLVPQKFLVRKSGKPSVSLIEYFIPKNALAGYYDVKITIFEGYQNNEGKAILRKTLATYEIPSAFEVVYEPTTGCVKHDDPRSSSSNDKTVLHVYGNRDGTLYRDGKVESQQPAEVRIELSDGIVIYDFSYNLTDNANPETDTVGPYWPVVLVILGIAVGVSLMIRKIGIKKNDQVFFQFAG
jgi:hypothetical protein